MRGDAYGRGYDNPDSADRGNAEEYSGAMDRLADDRRRAEAAQQSARPAVAQPIEPYRTGVNGGPVILFFLAGPLVVALLPTLAFLAGSAFLASLVSGLFVVALMPVLLRRQVTYRDAWRLSFAGLARYLIATVVVSFLVIWLRSPAVPWPRMESALVQAWSLTISTTRFSMVTDASTVAAAPIDTWPAVVGLGLLTRAPGFIWLTLALRSRLRRAYPVRSELIAAGVLALIAVEGALSVGWWAAGALSARSRLLPLTGDARLVLLVAYAVLTLLPCAVVGALVAGPALRAMMPGHGRQAGAAGRDTYLAALRAMLAFGALSVLAVVLFRDADPLLWRLVQAVIGGAPVPPFDASALRHASVALLVLALPGWMWAASIIAASYPRVYAGGRGYLKACAMAAVACAAVCLPLWALALRAFPIVLAQW